MGRSILLLPAVNGRTVHLQTQDKGTELHRSRDFAFRTILRQYPATNTAYRQEKRKPVKSHNIVDCDIQGLANYPQLLDVVLHLLIGFLQVLGLQLALLNTLVNNVG